MIDPHGSLVEQVLEFDYLHKKPENFVYLNPTLDKHYRL